MLEVHGDLRGDRLAAAAFDEPGSIQPVQRGIDPCLLLALPGVERVVKLLCGQWPLAVAGASQQNFEDGVLAPAIRGAGAVLAIAVCDRVQAGGGV